MPGLIVFVISLWTWLIVSTSETSRTSTSRILICNDKPELRLPPNVTNGSWPWITTQLVNRLKHIGLASHIVCSIYNRRPNQRERERGERESGRGENGKGRERRERDTAWERERLRVCVWERTERKSEGKWEGGRERVTTSTSSSYLLHLQGGGSSVYPRNAPPPRVHRSPGDLEG